MIIFNGKKERRNLKKSSSAFINYVYANIDGKFNLKYELFKKDENINHDEFIRSYYDGDYYVYSTNLYDTKKV